VFGISNEEEIEAAKKSLQSVHKRLCTPHIRFDLEISSSEMFSVAEVF